MEFYLYNTLTRKKELFSPIQNKVVKIYTCGPTVYYYAHIGNFRTFILEDVLVRYFKSQDYKVLRVMNFTDVDDKIIRETKLMMEKIALSETHWDFAYQGKDLKKTKVDRLTMQFYSAMYKQRFKEDAQALNLLPPDFLPSATDFIDEMVSMVQQLIDQGVAYQSEDQSVYFKINQIPSYGTLSHLDINSLEDFKSNRIDADEYQKDNVKDFVLWKAHKQADEEIYWDTVLGKGRPGWHLECSVMAEYFLGKDFDLHLGGVDNIFPHHENERAQSLACGSKDFSRYWMHINFLSVDDEKMSKSLGNIVLIQDLLKKWNFETIRMAMYTNHYRDVMIFNEQLLFEAEEKVFKLFSFEEDASVEESFFSALSEDLNIPKAIGELFKAKKKTKKILEVLGFNDTFTPKKLNLHSKIEESLLDRYKKAKIQKNFDQVNLLRSVFLLLGLGVQDQAGGEISCYPLTSKEQQKRIEENK